MANQRIVIVGTTGSGKSTLAAAAARRMGAPHIELDSIHWQPNWTERSTEDFRDRVAAALTGECWVVDGNYGKARDLVWGRADTLVWLDYPFWTVFGRLLIRTFRRSARRELLWGTNRESICKAISRDSILVWFFQSYASNRRKYRDLLRSPDYRHLRRVRVGSPRAADRWLECLSDPVAGRSAYSNNEP